MINIPYGFIEDIGWRGSMEDAHAIYQIPEKMFFSAEIYDGHGGKKAARIAAGMLTPCFLDLWAIEAEKPLKERRGESEILRQAYIEVDDHIVDIDVESGTTAATFYIIDKKYIVSNVGDTRIIAGSKAGVDLLTIDHKPSLPEERLRIEELGGFIFGYGTPRVQGILAVSRALGDARLKPFVSTEPRIVEGYLGRENDFVILACDGVWDVLTPKDVIEIARSSKNTQEGAILIKEKALDLGSTDNISVIVLDLRAYLKTCIK
ncbi:MAG: PP2C family protein-serine/threonine phosphatase [Proteobacteria bacterium]|nr:PP2C family protein-serine/threonine phosphatase [Pseudomonadota bacterium]